MKTTLLQEMCHAVQAVQAGSDARRKGQKRFNASTIDRIEEAYKSCFRGTAIIVT